MTYIRRYVPTDWPRLQPIARAFHAESPVHGQYPFEDARVWQLFDSASRDPAWFPMVAIEGDDIVGVIILFCVPMFFGPALEVGDLSLYVVPEKRKTGLAAALVHHGEKWAKEQGASVIRLGITTGIDDAGIERFLVKLGYERKGVQMHKSLYA